MTPTTHPTPAPDPAARCTCGGVLREQCCEPACAVWREEDEQRERERNDDERDNVL
jgi:hypothetical protein